MDYVLFRGIECHALNIRKGQVQEGLPGIRMESSAVHKALLKIARRLTDLRIPYVVAGGMALFFHGYRRFTEDVDIVVRPEGLQQLHQNLEGLDYVPLFPGNRGLRDAEHGVRIEFLVTGEYPGDGKPKDIAFPDPSAAAVEMEGLFFLGLDALVELKLASGASPGRRKDLGDMQELIRLLKLPAAFAERLRPSVRESYLTLWTELQERPPV